MKRTFTLSAFILFFVFAGLSSCNKYDSTVTPPTLVTTDVLVDATGTTAYTGGFLTSGNATAYGVVYSTSNQEPTIADTKTTETLNTLTFSSTVTGLSLNTTYYLRAYATFEGQTAYGNIVQFNTGADVSATYGQVSTVAGNPAGGFLNGTTSLSLFNSPMGVAADAAGNIYVADAFNSSIRKITPAGVVSTLAGTGSLGYADGAVGAAQFYSPAGIAVDASGNIFVADRGNNVIRKITPAGMVSTFAGSGTAGYTDGTGTAADFNTPTGLTITSAGDIYVADTGNNLIRKITAAGVVTTIAGSRAQGYTNGTGTAAVLNKPTGVALDAAGNIYITEPGNSAIRKIDANLLVTTCLGGVGAPAVLNSPNAIVADATGSLYISDGSGRILKLTAAKRLITLAGTAGTTGTTDGAGTSALFSNPSALAVDASGRVLVADEGNNLIRSVK